MTDRALKARISFHAMDRASERLLDLWNEQRADDEGLYTWLLGIAERALADPPVERRGAVWIYELDGVRLTCRYGLVVTVGVTRDEQRARRMDAHRWWRPFQRLRQLMDTVA